MLSNNNSANYNKLKNVLKEVFQLDQADLDFGIYRIMNQKRNEINDFLENRLLPQVSEILTKSGDGDNIKVQQELDEAIQQAKSLGVDADSLPKVIELRNKLSSTTSIDSLEQEVYSHLANFFKRYYKDGDFISLRRYKKDVYAIPYEGEEVKLHWANHDQYYIKTSEYLKNYGFKISNGKSVKFELKEASTEQNNNKEQSGKERRFQLYSELPYEVSDDRNTLIVNFTYEEHDNKVKQDKLNREAIDALVDCIPQEFHPVFEKRPTEKNKNRTLLEKHILDFTARNSFDYFIHKDLGGFLTRELDFYIKNEVLYLDDINTENEQDFTSQLSKVKAIKEVAQKIITFLAQLENFQKKLWLKKKFVVSTNYCITLDRIPESYYTEIVSNKEQLEEWKGLFKIHEQKDDLLTVTYSEPLTIDFLKSQPYLVLDTKFFSREFKDSLLAEFDDLDEQTNGLLINSENFQGINLIKDRFKSKIKTVYIDPPFNKSLEADYLYKVNYKDSSWLTLLKDRINYSKCLLDPTGSYFLRCDFDGNYLIRSLLNDEFGASNFLNEIIINRISKQDPKANKLNASTDSLFFYAKDKRYHDFNHIYKKLEKKKEARWHAMDSQGQGKKSFIFGKELAPPDGRHWTYGQKKILLFEESNKIRINCKDCGYKHYEGKWEKCPSCGNEKNVSVQYLLEPTDSKQLGSSWTDISGYSSKWKFKTENSEKLLSRVIDAGTNFDDEYVLDFFLGSGTTSAVAIKKKRKFIGIEMGNHFYTKVIPRIKQVIANKGSEPSGISKEENWNGCSNIFKYIELESYEDVLNNMLLKQSDSKMNLLQNESFKDDYMLNYMIDVETKESLLNIDLFKNPFNYKLKITRHNESKYLSIDLIETFNYLIGLQVKTAQTIRGYKVITGITREKGLETLIIWRNIEEKNNHDLNNFFKKMEFSIKDQEFQCIYVNGDNHLENLKTGDETWKVKLIEQEFSKLMFS